MESKLKVVDNSGAKIAKCIRICVSGIKKVGSVGDLILVTITKRKHQKKIKKNNIYYGLIITVKKCVRRYDGIFIKFTQNRILIFSKNYKFLGTRIYGPIMKEIKIHIYKDVTKKQRFLKLISYSNAII